MNCTDPNSYKDENRKQMIMNFMSEEAILKRTRNCDTYFDSYQTVADGPATADESTLSLAVAHSLHTQIGLFELQLALSYRPVDAHCVHIDLKADPKAEAAIRAIVRCYNHRFPNSTFVISRLRIPMFWGWASILDADLACLRILFERDKNWRYFLNPAGTEMPLVSHRRFRRALIENNGSNVLNYENDAPKSRQAHPYKFHRLLPDEFDIASRKIEECVKDPPPYGLRILKASKNVVLNRHFALFALAHPVAIEYYNWLIDTFIPDEHFYSVLATLSISKVGKRTYAVDQNTSPSL